MQSRSIYIAEPNEISSRAISMLRDLGYDPVTSVTDQSLIVGIFIRTYTRIDANYLTQFPNLKFILRAGVGLDNIDLAACDDRSIRIFNSPGANSQAVAEYIIGMMIFSLRQIGVQIEQVKNRKWRSMDHLGKSVISQKIGMLGFGHAGKALARLLKPLGVVCLGYDPYVEKNIFDKENVIKMEFIDVLRNSDVVVIMLPLTIETTHLLNTKTLTQMKKGSLLINVSRGEIIDESALLSALESGHINHAVLDVLAGEPHIDNHLLSNPNLTITPHIAGLTVESNEAIAIMAVESFRQKYHEGLYAKI